MLYFLFKTLITAFVIALISELARRYSLLAAILASIPLISLLSFIWIYIDTQDHEKIIQLSYSILWFVFPSLVFFLCIPYFLKQGLPFYLTITLSSILTALAYGAAIFLKKAIA